MRKSIGTLVGYGIGAKFTTLKVGGKFRNKGEI
jgi:hypothetical protein